MILLLPLLISLFFSIFKDEDKIISIYTIISLFIYESFIHIGFNEFFFLILILLLYWLISTELTNKKNGILSLFTLYLIISSIFVFYSNSLYGYFISVELISFLILIYINLFIQDSTGPGILYYLFSGLFSAFFIFSCGYLSMGYYISYSFLILVFLWKLNLVPFHFLIPSIYGNLSTKLIFYIDIPSKLLLFYLFYRILILINSSTLCYYIILINIIISSIIILIEDNLINILIYSSLINYSFILILIQFNDWYSFLLYLIFYSFMVLIYLHLLIYKWININNATFKNKFYIFFWSILLINLIGIPPFNGFLIKLLPLYQLIFNSNYILFIIIIFALLLISFIYLKILITFLMSSNKVIIQFFNPNSFISHFISSLLILLSFPLFFI